MKITTVVSFLSTTMWKSLIILFPKYSVKKLFILSLEEMAQEPDINTFSDEEVIAIIFNSIVATLRELNCFNSATKSALDNIVMEFLQDEF